MKPIDWKVFSLRNYSLKQSNIHWKDLFQGSHLPDVFLESTQNKNFAFFVA